MPSPYEGVSITGYADVTRQLIKAHPLAPAELVEVVQVAWKDIFASGFGAKQFKIGTHIFPQPQIMAFLLHELVPLELASRYAGEWTIQRDAGDKDVVYLKDDRFSIEIKASSHKSKIFGNRSYAQPSVAGKKSKDGYFLTVNFDKCTVSDPNPCIRQIKFGWLDHTDWKGQAAATGQQASLKPEAESYKLLRLFP